MAVGLSVRPWKPKSAVSAREEAVCSPAGLPSIFILRLLHSSLSASVWESETDPPYFTYPSELEEKIGSSQFPPHTSHLLPLLPLHFGCTLMASLEGRWIYSQMFC